MGDALAGLKVADFTWVGVGPVTIKSLADHGATVVHVESHNRVDVLRNAPPFKDREQGINHGSFFANFNTSKLGVSLNLAHPKALAVAKRLIEWSDVVAESFTPGTMAKWGLDYESVRSWKPDVVYYSTCQLGQTGPWAPHPGYGTQLAALAGFYHLASWPDGEPAGPYGAYTDFISPRFGITAILAALDHRRRTGKGTHVDLSQLEAGVQFIGPYLMDALNNEHEPALPGNSDPLAAPHGVYPCHGPMTESGIPEHWIAIAVFEEEQWRSLCGVLGGPEWAAEPRFASLQGRKEHEAELDERLGEWTRDQEAQRLMSRLQKVGVPAGVVQSCEALHADPQLAHWGGFLELEHQEIGRHLYDGLSFKLSKSPGRLSRSGPVLGQHNDEVYKGILGMDPEEYEALKADGVFE